MKNIILLITLSIFFFSCIQRSVITGGFYDKILKEKKIFKDYLKYNGNHQQLSLLDKNLVNTSKIIIVSTFDGFISYSTTYDVTNDKYYYLENDKEEIYKLKEISKEEVKPNFDFTLKYVLENRIDELKKISEEAYDLQSGMFIYIDILDTQSKMYRKYQFKEFEVYKGKPVMTKEEFYESQGVY